MRASTVIRMTMVMLADDDDVMMIVMTETAH